MGPGGSRYKFCMVTAKMVKENVAGGCGNPDPVVVNDCNKCDPAFPASLNTCRTVLLNRFKNPDAKNDENHETGAALVEEEAQAHKELSAHEEVAEDGLAEEVAAAFCSL